MDDTQKLFLKLAERSFRHQLESSRFLMVIWDDKPDMMLAAQIGLGVITDKPIIVLVFYNAPIPDLLRKIAVEIIDGGIPDTSKPGNMFSDELRERIDASVKRWKPQ